GGRLDAAVFGCWSGDEEAAGLLHQPVEVAVEVEARVGAEVGGLAGPVGEVGDLTGRFNCLVLGGEGGHGVARVVAESPRVGGVVAGSAKFLGLLVDVQAGDGFDRLDEDGGGSGPGDHLVR